jgi:hypothetical protein
MKLTINKATIVNFKNAEIEQAYTDCEDCCWSESKDYKL